MERDPGKVARVEQNTKIDYRAIFDDILAQSKSLTLEDREDVMDQFSSLIKRSKEYVDSLPELLAGKYDDLKVDGSHGSLRDKMSTFFNNYILFGEIYNFDTTEIDKLFPPAIEFSQASVAAIAVALVKYNKERQIYVADAASPNDSNQP
jgi:hypothetical protein